MKQKKIDEGLTCYGWELDIPEFYVVYGYDNKGYYFEKINYFIVTFLYFLLFFLQGLPFLLQKNQHVYK